ncbi:MAG: DUF1641 domain-containing protein [Actinobacteria bacterium]|nr:DUF1641 domain-containing protein [Actinomycetota bacterium]MCB8997807.1 DUF1641 domain-containing protein [Actinomycetota bacterium]MCB9414299.1 DUF1641 domain-containing protein [Actinomycetota bacterium]MCB9424044.1 DUF1641 domain-containing protein [Actinomycetota bacterium]HRY11019.1 DUF1641 domain-containing protein [Candidatus Nanopelagicales bacterium]
MTAEPTTVELAEQIERMSAQLDLIVAETIAQKQAREKWVELSDTLVPVTRGAMDMATRELDDLSDEVTADDLVRFARTAARSLPKLEALMAQLDSLSELLHTLNSLSGAAMGKATEVLAVADDKGYFAFAREGSKIADRVVTEFSEEDVRALGDNVVTILNAVKEMTQPEVMGLVQRTAISVQDVEETHMEPPSMFALLKQMRDPQTRRGLARVMTMLHTVGEEHPSTPTEEGK